MTFELSIPRLGRTKAWHLLMLAPVLPWFATLVDRPANPVANGPAQALSLILLGLLSGILAFRLPGWIESQPALIRKEIEQLRWPWMISVLAGQCFVLEPKDGDAFAAAAFMTSAFLLSAIPFGVEFQHRTVGHLLSQPALRSRIWSIKMAVPGIALGMGAILLLLSWLASGHDLDFVLARHLAVGVFVAWAATPWLTLVARGLLPGFVFSMTLPALALIPVIAFARWMTGLESSPDAEAIIRWVSNAVIWGFFPLYAVTALIGGYRTWNRLEAPDGAFEMGAGLFLPGRRSAGTPSHRGRRALCHVFIKELRLQSVTVIAVLGLITLTAAQAWMDRGTPYREVLVYGMILLSGTIALLSGATMIAEEQRLGTRDTQILLPTPVAAQWWIKFAVAAGLAAPAIVIGTLSFRAQLPRGPGDSALALIVWCLLASFAFACWSSSGRGNPLKALLWSIGWTAGAAVFLQAASQFTTRATMRLSGQLLDTPTPAALEIWMRKAQNLGLPTMEALARKVSATSAFNPTVFAVGAALAIIPLVAAVTLSRRNFARPAQAEHQWFRQNLILALVLITCTALSVAHAIADFYRKSSAELLVASWYHAQWLQKLRPTELELLQLHRRNSQWVWDQHVELDWDPSINAGQRMIRKSGRAWFRLPLSAADRRLVIEGARIDESLRDALRREAAHEVAPTPTPLP